jgi:hypothetical protein
MNLRTYADGYGRWHCVVSTNPGLTDTPQLRALARAAIRLELEWRDDLTPNYRLDIEICTQHKIAGGLFSTIDYVEKAAR